MKIPENWEEETKLPLVTSCKQAARLVSMSVERRLTFREILSMRIHLLMCKTCTRYRNQITALRKIFIRHEEVLDKVTPAEGESLHPDTKEKMQQEINRHV